MAALNGLGIDNATVTVAGGTAGEVPGGDGSSRIFVEALSEAGTVEQAAECQPLIIREPVTVTDGNSSLSALPGPTDRLEIVVRIRSAGPRRTTGLFVPCRHGRLRPPNSRRPARSHSRLKRAKPGPAGSASI